MDINPRDKAMMDAMIYITERHNTTRFWIRWCVVALVSVGIGLLVFVESLPGWLRIGCVVVSTIGILLFLIVASTTRFGKDIADSFRY